MKENLKILIKLQEIDKQLLDIEIAKGDLPKTIEKLNEDCNNFKTGIATKENKLVECEKERRRIEGAIVLAKEKLKKHQTQLYEVVTNVQYDAITQEIENDNKEIEDGENKILALMTSEEEDSSLLKEEKIQMVSTQKELKEKDADLSILNKENEKKELKLNHEREKLVVRTKKHIINAYNRIKKAKHDKIAIVPVTRESCGGCFKQIPPQNIVEIRKMNKINNCDVCGRITVWIEGISDINESE